MASYEDAKHEHFNFLPFKTKFPNFEIISPLYCMSNSETKPAHNERLIIVNYAGVTKPITPALTLFNCRKVLQSCQTPFNRSIGLFRQNPVIKDASEVIMPE